jgi:hypothetical protein
MNDHWLLSGHLYETEAAAAALIPAYFLVSMGVALAYFRRADVARRVS